MLQTLRPAACMFLALVATGCVSHDDASSGSIRLLNAVPDAPRMNLLINGNDAYTQVDYRVGSPFVVRAGGTYDIQVEEIMPGDDAVVIDLPDTSLGVGEEISLLVVGEIAEGTVEAWQITNTTRGVTTGKTRVQVAHAAPGGPRFDVYVTEPDTVLRSVEPFDTLGYKQKSGQRELKSGIARVRLTPPGDPGTVLFDSGSLNLPFERDVLAVVVASVGPGNAPVELVVLDNSRPGGFALFRDRDTPAELRTVNAYALPLVNACPRPRAANPDANPPVIGIDPMLDPALTLDVNLFAETAGGGITQIASELGFAAAAPAPATYNGVFPSSYIGTVIQSGDALGCPLLEFSQGFSPGSSNTYVLLASLGQVEDDGQFAALVGVALLDDPRRVLTEARLRIVHASPAAGPLDLTVSDAEGIEIANQCGDLDDQTAPENCVAVSLGGFARGDLGTGYIALAAGTYTAVFTTEVEVDDEVETVTRLTLPISVATGSIYTVIVRDKAGGGLPADVIRLDDLAAQ